MDIGLLDSLIIASSLMTVIFSIIIIIDGKVIEIKFFTKKRIAQTNKTFMRDFK